MLWMKDIKVRNTFIWDPIEGGFVFYVFLRGWLFWKSVGQVTAKDVDDALQKVQSVGWEKEGKRDV